MNLHSNQLQPRRRAFTLAELMMSLIVFALVATAGTYLMAATSNTQKYVQNNATSDSEVEFASQRIIENIRAGSAVTITSNTITITSPPSPLISGSSFTISYSILGSSLIEIYVNNSNSQTYSSAYLIHNVSQFSVARLGANAKAFQVTINAGTTVTVQRTFVALGRNL